MGFTYTEDFIRALVQAIVIGTGLNPITKLLLFDVNDVMLNNPYIYNFSRYPTSSGIHITGKASIVYGGLVKRVSAPIGENHSLFYFHYTFDELVGVDANTEVPVSMTVRIDIPFTVREGSGLVTNLIPTYIGAVLAGVYFPSVLRPRYLKVYGDRIVTGDVDVVMVSQTKCIIKGSVSVPLWSSVKSVSITNSEGDDLIVFFPSNGNYGKVEVEVEVGV